MHVKYSWSQTIPSVFSNVIRPRFYFIIIIYRTDIIRITFNTEFNIDLDKYSLVHHFDELLKILKLSTETIALSRPGVPLKTVLYVTNDLSLLLNFQNDNNVNRRSGRVKRSETNGRRSVSYIFVYHARHFSRKIMCRVFFFFRARVLFTSYTNTRRSLRSLEKLLTQSVPR